MGEKTVYFRTDARERVLKGTQALGDAVRVTLGPKSHCVLIAKRWGKPLVCNDGVTIAREFELADPVENLGAQMIRQAAEKTGEQVGDGTSTATLLACTLFAEGVRNLAAGASAVELKRGLEKGLRLVLEVLKGEARAVQSRKARAQVATVAAHNDSVMGELVADAMERVGIEGAITVEDSRSTETRIEVAEGMQFEGGYISPYFVTDAPKMEVVLENALVLLTERKVSHVPDFIPFLERVVKQERPLLVIAEDVEGEALATLVVNKLRGTLACAAVKAPGFGDRRKSMLEDIAILTGGQVVGEELGVKLDKVELAQLGSVRRVVVQKDVTTLVGGGGSPSAIQGRCAQLRSQIEACSSEYDRKKLQERLARLGGGVAVIRVGAASESEVQSRKEAFDDAISATKAAMAEGIVAGGGLALLRAVPVLSRAIEGASGDERTGLLILKRSLEAPARQIAENSAVDGGVVVERMLSGSGSEGFDAARSQYVNLVEAGIIDPVKVVRVALENAVSVAALLLLVEATMTEAPEKRDRAGREGELVE